MNLHEIISHVQAGHPVFWMRPNYIVTFNNGQYDIVCTNNGYTVGLTHKNGTLSDDPVKFFSVCSIYNILTANVGDESKIALEIDEEIWQFSRNQKETLPNFAKGHKLVYLGCGQFQATNEYRTFNWSTLWTELFDVLKVYPVSRQPLTA